MRICQVFSRRAYNIDSLVVSEGRTGAFSRMTIDISGNPQGLEQIIKQVNKLIDVIHCFEHTAENSVVREMLLVKIIYYLLGLIVKKLTKKKLIILIPYQFMVTI